MKKSKDFLTSRVAAEQLGVSLTTVQQWVEGGFLRAWKTAGGHRRIARNSVDEMLLKQQEATAGGPGQPPMTVVVVEDDPFQQQLYELKFEEWSLPAKLITTGNGFEGLLEIGRNRPDFIISDLDMPAMDGFEMIKAIAGNSELEDVKIIVVTGLTKAQIETKGGLPAQTPVLHKPIVFEDLKSILTAKRSEFQNER